MYINRVSLRELLSFILKKPDLSTPLDPFYKGVYYVKLYNQYKCISYSILSNNIRDKICSLYSFSPATVSFKVNSHTLEQKIS